MSQVLEAKQYGTNTLLTEKLDTPLIKVQTERPSATKISNFNSLTVLPKATNNNSSSKKYLSQPPANNIVSSSQSVTEFEEIVSGGVVTGAGNETYSNINRMS